MSILSGHVPDCDAAVLHSLSASDQSAFCALQSNLHSSHNGGFRAALDSLQSFVTRDARQVSERAIVAGICFAPGFICVNTARLKRVLGRGKTSINNGFQQLGYLSSKSQVQKLLFTAMPILQRCPDMARQWTIRYADPPHKRACFPVPIFEKKSYPELSFGCMDESLDFGNFGEPTDLVAACRKEIDDDFEFPGRIDWMEFAEGKPPEIVREHDWHAMEVGRVENPDVEISNWNESADKFVEL
jgi:hypothetical protein